MKLTGTLYFPTTEVIYENGASGVSFATAVVADTVLFTSDANIKHDSTGASTGMFTSSVALMQ
jgi:hypothetical protein